MAVLAPIAFFIGIIATILFILYFFTIECKKCRKAAPVIEIVRIINKRQLIGRYCKECSSKKVEKEAKAFNIFDDRRQMQEKPTKGTRKKQMKL